MATTKQETNVVSFKQIDKSIKALDLAALQQGNAAMADNLSTRVQKLVTVYSAIKPLLTVVATLPIIPANWRAAVAIFTQTLDAVLSAPELAGAGTGFKAGKDL